MPLTAFQREILSLLAQNRNPDNFEAGGIVLNRETDSPRFSKDIDFFHDVEISIAQSAKADVALLQAKGFQVEWTAQERSYYQGVVRRENDILRLEWAYDSAFRFFPIEKDPLTGFQLNYWDAATNKLLALAGRAEPGILSMS